MTKEERYNQLEKSFKESLNADRKVPPVEDDFRKLFDYMAPKLADIEFDCVIVDISTMNQWLDFNLFCPDELRISACMVIGQSDEEVMCSVSHHKHKLYIGMQENIDALVDAANKAISIAINGVDTDESDGA